MSQPCPRCGADNGCEVARTGRQEVKCWCMEVAMPASLAIAPAGATCLCRACAAGANDQAPNEKAPGQAGAFPAI